MVFYTDLKKKNWKKNCGLFIEKKKIWYLARVQISKNGSPTSIAETLLYDWRTKQNNLRSLWSYHSLSFSFNKYFFFLLISFNKYWLWILWISLCSLYIVRNTNVLTFISLFLALSLPLNRSWENRDRLDFKKKKYYATAYMDDLQFKIIKKCAHYLYLIYTIWLHI